MRNDIPLALRFARGARSSFEASKEDVVSASIHPRLKKRGLLEALNKPLGLSIFSPCYNDAKSIKGLVEDAYSTAKNLTSHFEVIVIDDGSTDNSRKVLRKLTKKYKNLKLVFHKENLGYGGALRSGFQTASKDLLFLYR